MLLAIVIAVSRHPGLGYVLREVECLLAAAAVLLLGECDVVFLRAGRQLAGLLADGLAVEALQVAREFFYAVQIRALRHQIVAVQVCRGSL